VFTLLRMAGAGGDTERGRVQQAMCSIMSVHMKA
jgi:hypothetical protein